MDAAALRQRLAACRSRGEIKRLGAEVDRDPALRAALVALVEGEGAEIDPEWAGKRLVRAALDRAEGAQERRNPIRRDEAFACAWCGADVPLGGARVRDHCPRCLRSLHVDVVPGDRAAGCGGILHPFRLELEGGEVILHHRCGKCGAERRVRAHPDDAVPPSLDPADLPGRERREEEDPRARTLPQRALDFVRRQGLWAPGQRVLVAVSGGVDSAVLLEVLARTQRGHGGRLEVASLDHGLRPEAAAEVAGVARRAAALGLPFHTRKLEIRPGPDLYSRARDARRAALLAVGADRIATGHQQDDQAETVLFHLLRGSGAAGLRGMQPLDPPWCRPLLEEPRARVEAWARAEGLAWVEDPSNPASQRGELRRLMPQLDAVHGGAGAALARSARLIAREDALLEELAAEAWGRLHDGQGLAVAGLQALHPALQLRLLLRLVAGCPRPVRADSLEAWLRWTPREGGRLPLAAGWALAVAGGRVSAGPEDRKEDEIPLQEVAPGSDRV